ncbi:MAG: hypothetical protein ACR2GT_09955 [Gaiellaceae bacterium]
MLLRSSAGVRAVARDVRQRLGDDVVGRGLDRRRKPRREVVGNRHREQRPIGQDLGGGAEAALGQDRRVDSASEHAEVVDRVRQLLAAAVSRERAS